jgi:GAF domain-containing protein
MRLRASHGLAAADLRSADFPGSAGAAQRALRDRVPVVIHDVVADMELGGRASVIGSGLRAVVCLPLLARGEPIGLAYADSRRPHATIDLLELELLRAFAERVALWVAARRVDATLLKLAAEMPPAWNEPFAIPASGAAA